MKEEIYGKRSLAANLNTEMLQRKASWRSPDRDHTTKKGHSAAAADTEVSPEEAV